MAFMDVTLDLLLAWHWPGNVRELQNMIHSLVITQKGPLITPDDLPIQISPRKTTPCSEEILAPRHSLKEIVAEMERDFLRKAVEAHGSVQKVAELYKVNRSTIFRKLRMPEIGSNAHLVFAFCACIWHLALEFGARAYGLQVGFRMKNYLLAGFCLRRKCL